MALRHHEAAALDAFRAFNYERIYLRPESVEQADRAARLITSLAAWYVEHPAEIGPAETALVPGSPQAVAAAVRHVSGMTDRFVARTAVERLGWHTDALPRFA